jgi:hypothetical protein
MQRRFVVQVERRWRRVSPGSRYNDVEIRVEQAGGREAGARRTANLTGRLEVTPKTNCDRPLFALAGQGQCNDLRIDHQYTAFVVWFAALDCCGSGE